MRNETAYDAGIALARDAIGRTRKVLDSEGQTIESWVAAIEDYAKHEKQDLVVALAFMSAQMWAYRKNADEDALLALHHVRRALNEFDERRGKAQRS